MILDAKKYKTIANILAPLNAFGIDVFFHIRIFENGQFILLSNAKKISQLLSLHLNEFLASIVEVSERGKMRVYVWPDRAGNSFFESCKESGIFNGINYILEENKHLDIFGFANENARKNIKNFYVTHVGLMKKFIIFYKVKASKIITEAVNCYINHVPEFVHFLMKKTKRHYISSKAQQRLATSKLIANSNNLVLMKRELEFIELFLEGKSIKNIAKEMNVSIKFANLCYDKLKKKTCCKTRSRLVEFFESPIA